MTSERTLITDTECYANFWSAGFKRVSDGKIQILELSARRQLNRERLRNIIENYCIVTFNGLSYDRTMLWAAIYGADNETLMRLSNAIINGRVRWWDQEALLCEFVDSFNGRFPYTDFVDLIEPQPNAVASLKTLNGRLHGKRMQDLPYAVGSVLTDEQMDNVNAYMGNDLDATHLLFDTLAEPLKLRHALGLDLKMDLRSKSDAQIGEAIIKKRVEAMTGRKVERVPASLSATFRYQVPDFIRFETPELQQLVRDLAEADFAVVDGKVKMPKWLDEKQITIGGTTYAMGIGGLHSTEANRSLYSDETHVLIDADVASQYPSIILKLGLFPKALGPEFLPVYAGIKADRLVAKRAKNKVKDQGYKIALNGAIGKLGSQYSILYAPHLLIAVTLTGQLSLLMLIERAEREGISVVSGNTDGVVFRCPRGEAGGFGFADTTDLVGVLRVLTQAWERETGFELEFARFRSIHNLSVNTYIAIKEDGKFKRKGGVLANPWHPDELDLRTQMMKNPTMTICSDAAVLFLRDGVPVEDTIRACRDIRSFVTVVNVQGGGTWRGDYLGKVVRYVWGKDGEQILYAKPHPKTGNFKKVSKTDGAVPMMELPDEFPDDLIDYQRYIEEAREILRDVGAMSRPPPPIKLKRKLPVPPAMLLAALL